MSIAFVLKNDNPCQLFKCIFLHWGLTESFFFFFFLKKKGKNQIWEKSIWKRKKNKKNTPYSRSGRMPSAGASISIWAIRRSISKQRLFAFRHRTKSSTSIEKAMARRFSSCKIWSHFVTQTTRRRSKTGWVALLASFHVARSFFCPK